MFPNSIQTDSTRSSPVAMSNFKTQSSNEIQMTNVKELLSFTKAMERVLENSSGVGEALASRNQGD
jgi:hypothetical protein